ncbi:MAG: DUF1349 domain-containing protein [Spirochaetota bacterium]
MHVDFSTARWLHQPQRYDITGSAARLTTEPRTDLWQRSYYGFSHDNAPALLLTGRTNFTFTVRARFSYRGRFDQCGVIVYLDGDNWFKASVEYEHERLARLGSVVTNLGYSDWATTDIPVPAAMWYRLSRRGPDFLAESSPDGTDFTQMRIFHLHRLGGTTPQMGRTDPPAPPQEPVRFGVYACSPLESSFDAEFDGSTLTACAWRAHPGD